MKNKSKKGFTLVEMVAVFALLAIVGVAVLSIMTPAGNMFTKMQKQSQAKMIASGVMQVIEPQARFGTNIKIVGSRTGGANRNLYADNGKVYIVYGDKGSTSPIDLFGSAFYNGYQVSINFGVVSSNTVTIQVTAKNTTDSSVIATLNTSVQNENTTTITDNGDILCYEWRTTPPAATS